MEPIQFAGRVRYWSPEKTGGLAVIDVPPEHVGGIGGLKQQRVHGTFGGPAFTSSVMPAGGGRLALSVSKAMLGAAKIGVGDPVDVVIARVGRE